MNPDPTSLDRLHDIVVPPPVPWWPPAPGWYGVIGIGLFVLLALALRGFLIWQHSRYRREALAEWRRQESLLHDVNQRSAALAALAELVKRAALSAFPREEVAALTGPQWLAFLDRTGKTTEFSSPIGALLESVAYDSRSASALDELEVRKLAQLVQHWLEHHRVGGAGEC